MSGILRYCHGKRVTATTGSSSQSQIRSADPLTKTMTHRACTDLYANGLTHANTHAYVMASRSTGPLGSLDDRLTDAGLIGFLTPVNDPIKG